MANPLAEMVSLIAASRIPELMFLAVLVSPVFIFSAVPVYRKAEARIRRQSR